MSEKNKQYLFDSGFYQMGMPLISNSRRVGNDRVDIILIFNCFEFWIPKFERNKQRIRLFVFYVVVVSFQLANNHNFCEQQQQQQRHNNKVIYRNGPNSSAGFGKLWWMDDGMNA